MIKKDYEKMINDNLNGGNTLEIHCLNCSFTFNAICGNEIKFEEKYILTIQHDVSIKTSKKTEFIPYENIIAISISEK